MKKSFKLFAITLAALLTISISLSACDNTTEKPGTITPPNVETPDEPNDNKPESPVEPDEPSTPSEPSAAEQLLTLAYQLATGETLEGTHTLTGVIISVDTPYSSSKGICVTIVVENLTAMPMYCYQLIGEGVDVIGEGDTITVSGIIKNYKGTIEFDKNATLLSYTLADKPALPDDENDPYDEISKADFYANYTRATSNTDAYYRTKNGLLSGENVVPDQAPTISEYQPKQGEKLVRNTTMRYSADGNTYTVVDAYGNKAFDIYRNGAYITLEEVAAYVYAFGTYPANYTASKNTRPSSSVWKEYLRVNHSKFSGDTRSYPYEPELPNITGCGGTLQYYEMDIGTTGTDCDPSYPVITYNNGTSIERGAARIVYGKRDINGNGIFEAGELHVFYTYNHYNDFQEYLNYANGWGEMFGNITGGGILSDKYNCSPTAYVDVVWEAISSTASPTSIF